MTDAVTIALIAAAPGALGSFVAAWLGWLNRQKIAHVEHSMNSLLDKRVEDADQLGEARGRAAGAETERTRKEEHS
jgi:hypothetical protein